MQRTRLFAWLGKRWRFSPDRRAWSVALCAVLVLASLLDLALVCGQIGVLRGLASAAHDPGKFFFHLALLPLASMSLVLCFPASVLRELWANAWQRSAWCAVTGALVVGVVAFCVGDARAGFEERIPWPSIVSARLPSPDPELSVPRHLDRLQQRLRAEVTAKTETSQGAIDRYRAEVESICPGRRFWPHSSPRAKVAALLTLAGGLFAAALLSTIALLVIARSFHRDTAHALSLVVMLASFWLLLRAYSEWYGNFNALEWQNNAPFLIALVAVLIGTFFLWVLRDWKNPAAVATATLGALVAIAAAIGELKPEWVQGLAVAVAAMKWPSLLALYVLLSLFFSGMAYTLAIPRGPSASAVAQWGGVFVDQRFFSWSDARLNLLMLREPTSGPDELTATLARDALDVAYVPAAEMPHRATLGYQPVYETDRREWRRHVLASDGAAVLMVRASAAPAQPLAS